MIRIEWFWGDNISLNWGSKLIASIHLLMLAYNVIFCISSLKTSSHSNRYIRVLLSVVIECVILIDHIHHLEGIYRILLDSAIICLLAVITLHINHFLLKVRWMLNCIFKWYWNRKISFALALRSSSAAWTIVELGKYVHYRFVWEWRSCFLSW